MLLLFIVVPACCLALECKLFRDEMLNTGLDWNLARIEGGGGEDGVMLRRNRKGETEKGYEEKRD